ncbi:MAG: 16S rRNA (uracil(1498)-N(3))-methyltransferase [Flavobacteriaceae bacterium]|nr:16S rRNA (uracil(1498)-N(3))-methyltransferase [Flavobacteriaceae bacterium]
MDLFFHEHIDTNNSNLVFDTEESSHLSRVLRKQEGDVVTVTDGKGLEVQVKLENIDSRRTNGVIEESKIHPTTANQIHIAIAPTKNIVRLEWFLEKATEIGVHRISPILCKHSERKVIKKDRLLKIIKSALKQSQKFHLPQLDDLVPFNEFVERQGKGFIAHCNEGEKLDLADLNVSNKNNCVLIGPEGDFNKVEVAFALKNNFVPISLGDQRLRTETAGLVACHTLSLINRKV